MDLINTMTHEKHDASSILFEINSIGDKFYLILNGKVGVFVPG